MAERVGVLMRDTPKVVIMALLMASISLAGWMGCSQHVKCNADLQSSGWN